MFPDESLLLFLQKRGLTINSHSTQKHHHNSNSHNKQQLDLQSNCTHFVFWLLWPPATVYKIKDVLITHYIFHPIPNKNTSRNFTELNSTTHDLLCHLFISFFLGSYKQKQPKTIDKTFPITHNTLIQLVTSLIQNNPAFWPIQNKTILTTLAFHDVFVKILHLITNAPP